MLGFYFLPHLKMASGRSKSRDFLACIIIIIIITIYVFNEIYETHIQTATEIESSNKTSP